MFFTAKWILKMSRTDITIIGAGVVGLAIAYSISDLGLDVTIIDKHDSFGREASSRNSEVIHASIYYPQNSLKGRLCLEGNKLMYRLCKDYCIPYSNCGKLIVANNKDECNQLNGILENAIDNGAHGVRIVNKIEIFEIEPNVHADSAIFCPSSGIVDSHKLMEFFEQYSKSKNVNFVYNHEVKELSFDNKDYRIIVKDKESNEFQLTSKIIINSAGLMSGRIAELLGIDIDKHNYRINYHKGIYFRVNRNLDKYPKALIYPLPPESGSVGIHTTPDLYGGMRLGPHFFWSDEIDYSVDNTFLKYFFGSAVRYLPFLDIEDLKPDMAGIMSSIQKEGEMMKDFVIREESDKGFPGLINLIGMESPALTASPAIGEYVKEIVMNLIRRLR